MHTWDVLHTPISLGVTKCKLKILIPKNSFGRKKRYKTILGSKYKFYLVIFVTIEMTLFGHPAWIFYITINFRNIPQLVVLLGP